MKFLSLVINKLRSSDIVVANLKVCKVRSTDISVLRTYMINNNYTTKISQLRRLKLFYKITTFPVSELSFAASITFIVWKACFAVTGTFLSFTMAL